MTSGRRVVQGRATADLEGFIVEENIKRYRHLLDISKENEQKSIISKLLSEEIEKKNSRL